MPIARDGEYSENYLVSPQIEALRRPLDAEVPIDLPRRRIVSWVLGLIKSRYHGPREIHEGEECCCMGKTTHSPRSGVRSSCLLAYCTYVSFLMLLLLPTGNQRRMCGESGNLRIAPPHEPMPNICCHFEKGRQ